MRARNIVLAISAVVILSVPAIILAQGFHKGGRGRGGAGFSAMHPMGYHGLAPRMMERLGVTAEQRALIEEVLAEEQTAMQELRGQLRKGQEEFHATYDPAVFDEVAVRAFAEAQAKLQAEIMVAGMRTRARIHTVLTPEQAEQLTQMRGGFRGRRRGPAGP